MPRHSMNAITIHNSSGPGARSANKDWLRALQRTAQVETQPDRILPVMFDAIAAERGAAIAVIDERQSLSFEAFAARANRWSRWALAQNLRKGGVVALLMGNCADYAAIWLGLTRVGVIVALLNTNLAPSGLAHCLRAVGARRLIADDAFELVCESAAALLERELQTHLATRDEASIASMSGAPLTPQERRDVSIRDRALYIFTSGTTGLPKAAIVTHRRLLFWSLWFSGLADMGPQDRMYDCLPMYHSVGGVVAVFGPLLAGGSVVLRRRFSASNFWTDVESARCTLFQYIGELCRYLVNAPDCEAERSHTLRLAIGNGLRADVWTPFAERFRIPRILEFYAATEGNFSLYNVEGEPGAIGRIPSFLASAQDIAIVRFDQRLEAPARDDAGRCVRCGADEVGEAIARINAQGGVFEGYASRGDSENKILRDVFEPGDAWMRSGDLMRKDARGFFYFADRIGDSFRWKGENVSSFEVAETLAACSGVREATVYGVAIPGYEGRAGMAALVVESGFDLAALRRHVAATLPAYARPLFVRLSETLEITETFKHKKQALLAAGFDPAKVDAELYFAVPGGPFIAVDAGLHDRILGGDFRL